MFLLIKVKHSVGQDQDDDFHKIRLSDGNVRSLNLPVFFGHDWSDPLTVLLFIRPECHEGERGQRKLLRVK